MRFFMFILSFALLFNIAQAQEVKDKPAIILVAFGTSDDDARKVFDHIDITAKKNFPKYRVFWGFTAKTIVKKLRESSKDNGVLTLDEAIDKAIAKGYNKILLQSLHVVAGQKDKELYDIKRQGVSIVVGSPLMTGKKEDVVKLLKAVSKDIKKENINIFAGHGNDHHPEYNKELVTFNNMLRAKDKNSWLLTVEGKPGIDAIIKEILPILESEKKTVNFIPLMIVAGDHILNDVVGAEDDSWKSLLKLKEYSLTKSLGYNNAVLEIYFNNIKEALANFNNKNAK
jgi:sirohydrochlorin cobaltochelatase